MIQLRIKDVDLRVNLLPNLGIVEEETAGELQLDPLQQVTDPSFFKSMAIRKLKSLSSKRTIYEVPVPERNFPGPPTDILEFENFLIRAIKLTEAIIKVHQTGCCFGILRKDRILMGPENELIVLGLALFQKEYSKNDLSLYQEDDFYFIAPEFNSRSNRTPDQRSDLYSLGVLLHFWLTGEHFIKALDKQEVLHKHLTETYDVDAMGALWKDTGIYQILQGLVEKRPEDRYQSAHGVLKDLKHLKANLGKQNQGALQRLSLQFNPGVINFSKALMERSDALQGLLDAYDEICNGASAVVFLEGSAGIGKSFLGKTFETAITDSDALFSRGGFDEKQSTPYRAFQQAFQNIAQRILLKSGKSHAEVRDIFISGLGPDLSALFKVIPDLKELTGNLPKPETLDPLETGDRFVNLFARYCRTLDGIGLKRVLFIDDVQWCDESSLKLIEYMAWAPISRVMFVLSYNPDGMSEDHPLRIFQQSLKKGNKEAPIIKLNPLSEKATTHMVADALSEKEESIGDLAGIVYKKTHGNPYHIKHFLTSLQEEGALHYDLKAHKWLYHLEQVKLQEMTENVLAVHEKQLLLQSYQAQVLLKVAAFDNGKFNIPLLASVCDFPKEIVVLLLELLTEAEQLTRLESTNTVYTFSHNRIQQAAYQLKIPGFEVSNEAIHYALVQFYLKNGNLQSAIELNQFVEHLMQSGTLLDQEIATRSIGFVHQAGQLANDSNSPSTALQYLSFGLELQEKFKVPTLQYDMLFGLAKASYLLKSMENAKSFSDRALKVATDIKQRGEVYLLNLKFNEAYSFHKENVREGLKALEALGHPLEIEIITEAVANEYTKFCNTSFTHLKKTIDKDSSSSQENRYVMDILASMCTSAQRIDQDVYALILLRLGNLQSKFGKIESTPFFLIHLGALLCYRYHSFDVGVALGTLGLGLVDAADSDRYYSKSLSVYHTTMGPLRKSYKELGTRLEHEIDYCVDRGDIQGTHHLLYTKMRNQLLIGANLEGFLGLCEKSLEHGNIHSNEVFVAQVQFLKSIGLMLSGSDPAIIKTVNEKTLQLLENCDCKAAEATYHILVGWTYCLKGNYEEACSYFTTHSESLQYRTTEPQFFRYQTLQSLCDLMLMDDNSQSEVLERVAHRQNHLRPWADISPKNFMAEFLMIELLLACKSGDLDNLANKIEAALRWTEKGNLISVRAMLTSVLHKALPNKRFTFLKQALKNESENAFAKWGVKIDGNNLQLDLHNPPQTIHPKVNSFDFQSLIKATQTISAEVNRDRLVQNLLQIVMENAGADKGALILSNNSNLTVAASIDLTKSITEPFVECDLNTCPSLPISLIEHVALNKKELCIDDLANYCSSLEDSPSDTTGSLLLMPLIKQGDLVGLLYVANSQMTGMFTEGGLEVFRIIASQAAISITNSTLYEKAITLNRELASSQKELAKLNQALEEKIRERTQHLRHEIEMRKEAERDLIFAKNDADNANKAKSQFLANMSHEIRTPLNAIVGFAQILSNQSKSMDLTNSFRRYLGNIYQSAESLSEIIRDILDLSKIEAGKTSLVEEDMDLRQLFFSVYRIQNSMAKAKDVKVVYSLSPATPRYIHSDRGKIKQVLMNIVGNAIKFTPSTNSVTIGLCANDDFLVFKVSDEGIGIPASDLERIFEPFTQSDAGMDRKYGGTGLGLTITKSLVDILNGQLTVESEEGKGTCFTIQIPYKPAAPPQVDCPETLLAKYRVPKHSKILVVEDNPMNQEMIRALFSELGSEILLASNGKESIAMAKRFCPDIIFMDIHMPEMDGFETLKMIRKFNLETPIIGLSADAFKEHQEAALDAGFSAYLTKPIQLTKLVGLLRKYLPDNQEPLRASPIVLDQEQVNQKLLALEAIQSLPIFETEKLAEIASTLNGILPPESFSMLEDAIYTGDETALREFLTTSLNA